MDDQERPELSAVAESAQAASLAFLATAEGDLYLRALILSRRLYALARTDLRASLEGREAPPMTEDMIVRAAHSMSLAEYAPAELAAQLGSTLQEWMMARFGGEFSGVTPDAGTPVDIGFEWEPGRKLVGRGQPVVFVGPADCVKQIGQHLWDSLKALKNSVVWLQGGEWTLPGFSQVPGWTISMPSYWAKTGESPKVVERWKKAHHVKTPDIVVCTSLPESRQCDYSSRPSGAIAGDSLNSFRRGFVGSAFIGFVASDAEVTTPEFESLRTFAHFIHATPEYVADILAARAK